MEPQERDQNREEASASEAVRFSPQTTKPAATVTGGGAVGEGRGGRGKQRLKSDTYTQPRAIARTCLMMQERIHEDIRRRTYLRAVVHTLEEFCHSTYMNF